MCQIISSNCISRNSIDVLFFLVLNSSACSRLAGSANAEGYCYCKDERRLSRKNRLIVRKLVRGLAPFLSKEGMLNKLLYQRKLLPLVPIH